MPKVSESDYLKQIPKKGREILSTLVLIGKNREWLAGKIGISRPTLDARLKAGAFKAEERKRMEKAFDSEFKTN